LDLNESQRLNLVQLKVSQKVKEPTTFSLVCKIRVYMCAKVHVLFLTIKRYCAIFYRTLCILTSNNFILKLADSILEFAIGKHTYVPL